MYRYDIHKVRKDNFIPDSVGNLPESFYYTRQQFDEEVKGKFKEIIDLIFSEPSSLCSKVDDYVFRKFFACRSFICSKCSY